METCINNSPFSVILGFWAYLQGMETDVRRRGLQVEEISFWAYLQGMETCEAEIIKEKEESFEPTYKEWKLRVPPKPPVPQVGFEPTYKEWKLIFTCSFSGHWGVLSLPTRNGNSLNFSTVRLYKSVLSLPTRNGNFVINLLIPHLRESFEPTYKEWKPYSRLMSSFILCMFWAYLQGMET